MLGFLEQRFGIARSVFDGHLLLGRKGSWTLIRRTAQLEQAAQLKVAGVGLRAFRRVSRYLKPTTRMIQCFGRFATRGRVELDEEQLRRLIQGEALTPPLTLSPGYIILTLPGDRVVGLGFWAQGKLRSQLPHKGLSAAMLGGQEGENHIDPEEE